MCVRKYIYVYIYVQACMYRDEQSMGTAGEMRTTAMELNQTRKNRIKPRD